MKGERTSGKYGAITNKTLRKNGDSLKYWKDQSSTVLIEEELFNLGLEKKTIPCKDCKLKRKLILKE